MSDLRLVDAKTLAAAVRRGEIGPALELARRVKPITVEDLLQRAVGDGLVTVECFDACADAYAAYTRMREKQLQAA